MRVYRGVAGGGGGVARLGGARGRGGGHGHAPRPAPATHGSLHVCHGVKGGQGTRGGAGKAGQTKVPATKLSLDCVTAALEWLGARLVN